MILHLSTVFLLISAFLINQTLSLQCSTESDTTECNHSYNGAMNESACALWWSFAEPDYKEKIFQLPPMNQACISNDDFFSALSTSVDFRFIEACFFQKDLPLAGFCFCKTGNLCNGKLLNDTAKLNDLLSKMPPPLMSK